MSFAGVWLPIVTPFYQGAVDYGSYEKLIRHFLDTGISGIVCLGTTGEASTLEDDEQERLVELTVACVAGLVPVYVGLGGSSTARCVRMAKLFGKQGVDGFLVSCPAYNRPSQEGLYQHFAAIAEATEKDLVLYNIPYRTGVNLQNETLWSLAQIKNIIGIKDCSGSLSQSLALLGQKPDRFSVLTGEDEFFYGALAQGADGGILASAHLFASDFLRVFQLMRQDEHQKAREIWKSRLQQRIPLLFQETNPAPIKFCLRRRLLIRSDEVRLPLVPVSEKLKSSLALLDL